MTTPETPGAPAPAVPVDKIRNALLGYRIMAWTTGVALLLLCLAICGIGAGIGICWAFVAQRIMSGARKGEEAVAASIALLSPLAEHTSSSIEPRRGSRTSHT